MTDSWEIQYFGTTTRYGNDDFDGDGLIDRAEYAADTNPTNAASFLRISAITLVSQGIKIDWTGGIYATQYLQRNFSLVGTNPWLNIFTAPPPTTISGSYMDLFGTNALKFYRIKATRP